MSVAKVYRVECQDGWMVNWKETGRRRSLLSQGTNQTFAWKDCRIPRKNLHYCPSQNSNQALSTALPPTSLFGYNSSLPITSQIIEFKRKQAGRPGFDPRYGAKYYFPFHGTQTGSGVHPPSYTIGFSGKAAGAWRWPLHLVPRSHTSSWLGA
jgi:hypothetical protein